MAGNDHDQPIIHRDLKTPNLLMACNPIEGEEVHIKITDFGLSRDKDMDSDNKVRLLLLALVIRLACVSSDRVLWFRRWR